MILPLYLLKEQLKLLDIQIHNLIVQEWFCRNELVLNEDKSLTLNFWVQKIFFVCLNLMALAARAISQDVHYI